MTTSVLEKTFSDKNNAFGSMTIIRMGVDNIPNTINLIGPDGTVDYDRVTNFSAADYAFLLSYGQKLGQSGIALGGLSKSDLQKYRNLWYSLRFWF